MDLCNRRPPMTQWMHDLRHALSVWKRCPAQFRESLANLLATGRDAHIINAAAVIAMSMEHAERLPEGTELELAHEHATSNAWLAVTCSKKRSDSTPGERLARKVVVGKGGVRAVLVAAGDGPDPDVAEVLLCPPLDVTALEDSAWLVQEQGDAV